MSFTRVIAHNTFYQAIGRVFSVGFAAILVAFITRYLGPERFGNFTTVITFLQFFGIIIDFGLILVTVQMMSESLVPKEELLGNLFALRFISALLILAFAPFIILFFPYPSIVKSGVAWTLAYFFFIALNQVLVGFLQQKYQAAKIALSEILGRFFFFFGIIATIRFDLGLFGIIGSVTLGSFVNFFLNFLFVRKIQFFRMRFDFFVWKKIFSKSWPVAIGIIFNLIYLKADTLILALYRSQTEVGIYGAPYRILEILIGFPLIFILFLLNRFTELWKEKNFFEFKNVLQKSFDALALVTVPMVVGTWMLAEKIMIFVAGEEFRASGAILRILIFATGILFLGQLFGHVLVAINKQREALWIYICGAFVGLALYFFLIPQYAYAGAAWATVGIEALVNILLVYWVWSYSQFFPRLKILLRACLASLVMGLFLFLGKDLHVLFLIFFGMVVYGGAIFLFRGISKELLREIFKKNS